MKLIYPALTTTTLLLTASPSFASTKAITITIDWSKVAIAGGLVLATFVTAFFMLWVSLKINIENGDIFMFASLGVFATTVFVFVYFSL